MTDAKASCRAIYECYKTLFRTNISEFEHGRLKLGLPVVPIPIMNSVCEAANQLFLKDPIVLDITGNVIVIGDLHGHILDLFRILQRFGSPSKQTYLFLGDLVDRGEFSTETLTLVLIMKVLWPENVYVIRGNHEFVQMWGDCGFMEEVLSLYGNDAVLQDFINVLSALPVAAIVNGRSLCVHGGIGPEFKSVDQLRALERPIHDFVDEPLVSLLWSDPVDKCDGFKPSARGSGFYFGQKETEAFLRSNNLDLIIRGHQCVKDGCEFMFNEHLVTVFSCSNYCGVEGNRAGVLLMRPHRPHDPVRMESLEYIRRDSAVMLKSTSETTFALSGPVIVVNDDPPAEPQKMAKDSSSKTLPAVSRDLYPKVIPKKPAREQQPRPIPKPAPLPESTRPQVHLTGAKLWKLSKTSGEIDVKPSSPASYFRLQRKLVMSEFNHPRTRSSLEAERKKPVLRPITVSGTGRKGRALA